MQAENALYVALDFPAAAPARTVVDALAGLPVGFKLGQELLLGAGPGFARELIDAGHPVFLDLKLHEIPNSVSCAVRAAGLLGVHFVTVHASGGRTMMEAAREAAADHPRLQVLAVTVVTHLGDDDLAALGIAGTVGEHARRLAQLVRDVGLAGVVTSAHEAATMRSLLGEQAAVFTAGVRPAGVGAEDQRRIGTPGEAVRNGASHLIVGRPITRAEDPREVATAILDEITEARST